MKPIQQYSFLYLMKNYNTAMIGFSKGKSISYLSSICSSIMSNSNDKIVSFHKLLVHLYKYREYKLNFLFELFNI